MRFFNGILSRFFYALAFGDHIGGNAIRLAVLRHSVCVVRLGKPHILRFKGGAVKSSRFFQSLAYLFEARHLALENDAPFLDRFIGVGKLTVFPAAHCHVLNFIEVRSSSTEQRFPTFPGDKCLAAVQFASRNLVHARFNACSDGIFYRHNRGKPGVADNVSDVCSRIAQHSQIPPRVPFVNEPGGHLTANVAVDVGQNVIPLRLVFRPQKPLRQLPIDLELRRLFIPVPLVDLLLQILYAALHLIQLRLRAELFQYARGLQGLCCAALVLHHIVQYG